MTITLNQNRADFETWLKSLPETEYAIAADPCHCWIARWVKSQGFSPWGVFTELSDNFSREILFGNPEEEDFDEENDRVDMENWVNEFALDLDIEYAESMKTVLVSRDQALEILEAIV